MNDPDVTIRPMRREDIPAVIELWQQAGLSVRPHGRDSGDALAKQWESMGRHFWIAERAPQVIGAVLGTHDSRKGWINRLAVHPNFRGRGVAAALVARVEQSLAEDGIEIFAALIEEGNDASKELFERLNYELLGVYYFRKPLRDSV